MPGMPLDPSVVLEASGEGEVVTGFAFLYEQLSWRRLPVGGKDVVLARYEAVCEVGGNIKSLTVSADWPDFVAL